MEIARTCGIPIVRGVTSHLTVRGRVKACEEWWRHTWLWWVGSKWLTNGAMLPCHDDAILSTIRSHLLEWAWLEKHREARGSGNGDINKRLVLFLGIILATILDNYRIFWNYMWVSVCYSKCSYFGFLWLIRLVLFLGIIPGFLCHIVFHNREVSIWAETNFCN